MENILFDDLRIWECVKESIDAYTFYLKQVKKNNVNIIKHNRKKLNSIEHADELIESESSLGVLIEYDGIDFYYSIYNVVPVNTPIDKLLKLYGRESLPFNKGVKIDKQYIQDDYLIITNSGIDTLSNYLVDNMSPNIDLSSNVYSHIIKRFNTVE